MGKSFWRTLKPLFRFTYKTIKSVLVSLFWIILIVICLVMGFSQNKWAEAAGLFGIVLVIYVIRYLAVKIKEAKRQNPPPGR
ncbi:hypothetical protein MHM_01760 [Candidatus Mycoplasma haemominutum 'Birmingham 1']|uniref:Uncharacterized protein n=1 Tax=Candidatus Mycoplasma haematominutum 'Birmingham 1' TaxID=1116213 RepID=G8C2Z6_9MOLU|nr:hypothetical protein MHM_01760 [Candidatus Mycoplasma haematominutum 'Birmingham 1']